MDYDTGMWYPLVRRERIGDTEEVKCSLVDVRNCEVVAFWIEKDSRDGFGGENESVDENENVNYLGLSGGENKDPYSVFVGNLRSNVTKQEVVTHFAVVGEILRVTLLRGRKEGKTYAAFIKFAEQAAAVRALFLDGSYLMGSMIKVREKLANEEDSEVLKNSEMDPLSVFVGNLDHRTTTLELTRFLQQAGIIEKVTVLRNRETGKHKGAAYAQFRDRGSMLRALTLDGCVVRGKCVKVRRKRKTVSGSDVETGYGIKRARTDSSSEEEDPKCYEACSERIVRLY